MRAETSYRVVVSVQRQFAIVPITWPLGEGWGVEGFVGSSHECAAYVEAHWLDMRPIAWEFEGASVMTLRDDNGSD